MSSRKKKVEEKVKKRSIKRFFGVLFGVLMGVAIVGVSAFLIISIFFTVKKVEYEGTTIYTDEQLTEMIFTEEYDKNCVYVWAKNKVFPRKDIPFVESITVRMKNPNTLKITVKEKAKVCRMTDVTGMQVYFDSNNVVTEVSDVVFDTVPVVTMEDVELSDLSVGDPLPFKSKRGNELKNLMLNLKEQGIGVSALHFSSEGGIFLTCEGITINFGSSANTDAKILRLKYILPQLQGMSGTLHLEDWTEGNRDIVFEKNE